MKSAEASPSDHVLKRSHLYSRPRRWRTTFARQGERKSSPHDLGIERFREPAKHAGIRI
jgi:hypothetical protein